jgi:hypothetical protein
MEAILASEGKEARQEADQTAVMFGDGGGQIVVIDFFGDAAHGGEGVNVTPGEGYKVLAVRELQVQHPAMRFHQGEGIQLASVAGIFKRAEVLRRLMALSGNLPASPYPLLRMRVQV